MIMIILNMSWSPYLTETKITYLSKLISDIFWAIDWEHIPRNGGSLNSNFTSFPSPAADKS